MFQQVLKRLIEEMWKTTDQGDFVLAQYKKFISEAKKYHQEIFAAFKFREDRLDFFSELLHTQNKYEDLWETLKVLLTLSHGGAVVKKDFQSTKKFLIQIFRKLA